MTLNESSTAAQNATAAQFNLKFNLLYTLYSLPNTVRRRLSSCPRGLPLLVMWPMAAPPPPLAA